MKTDTLQADSRLFSVIPPSLIPSWSTTPWARFAFRKVGTLLLSFVLLIFVTFLIVQLIPGDPARLAAGLEADQAQVEQVRRDLGLDAPWWVQFGHYVQNIFNGSLGYSYRIGTVGTQILLRAPYTLIVAFSAIVITLLVAILAGIGVAVLTRAGRRRWLDVAFSWVTAFIDAIPVYVRGTVLIIVFALSLSVLPAGGAQSASSFVLPIIALSIGPVCSLSRVVRREAESAFESDFIRTAEGWRLSRNRINFKYLLPNVATSALTMSGLMLSGMIGGALIMEQVFSWPGLGTSVVNAIINRDYPVVQGTILVLGMVAVIINIIIDVVLALIDPRTLTPGSNS